MNFQVEGLRCSVNEINAERLELNIEGQGRIVWPNREGEGFFTDSVYPVLKAHKCLETGIAVSWPATASSEAVMIKACKYKAGFIFHTESPSAGLHREIRIFADASDSIRLVFSGAPVRWKAEELAVSGADIFQPPRYQFQIGLIGPDGSSVSEGEGGFSVLPGIASSISKSFGYYDSRLSSRRYSDSRPVIHLFGYAEGHDCGYPDYTPSARLGGAHGLSAAAEKLHKHGFLLSCYLNARIAEEAALKRYPLLQAGICRHSDGTPVIEEYNNRRFNVMDPMNDAWTHHLYGQAMMLRECGADAVQLDQVSGRAPVVPPGSPWGAGYKALIERLHKDGLQVWIQGVSDYYPADYFEMTHRELSILPGGILRGGNPFGETDLSLLKALNPGGSYLVPLEKAKKLEQHYGSLEKTGLPLIIDVMNVGEELPLYGEAYLSRLLSSTPCF